MGSFLKKILEPSEQDAFDHLTWMEKPCIDIFEGLSSEDVLPSPNVGLPSALIPREPPGPAYVTHTGPLVRLLLRQERLGRAGPAAPRTGPGTEPGTEPRTEPRSPAERSPGRSTGSGPTGIQERSPGILKKSPRASPRLCRRVIFARKPPSPALPRLEPRKGRCS